MAMCLWADTHHSRRLLLRGFAGLVALVAASHFGDEEALRLDASKGC